jgi:hypothetical protein
VRKILGYVLAKDTNAGLQNLIVSAYGRENSDDRLREAPPLQDGILPTANLGNRIGSVLTNQDGWFILESKELGPSESPTDLVVVVYAPEDVQDVQRPYPLPPEERILYISNYPREDPGAEEAYVIRILRSQVDRFHLTSVPAAQDSKTGGDRLATSIEETWDFEERLRARLEPHLLDEQTRTDELQALAKERTQNLSAIPVHRREGDLTNVDLLINGRADLADSLKSKLDKAMADGLQRMRTRNPRMRVSFTESELTELGLTVEDGELVGEVDREKLATAARARMTSVDLVRKRAMEPPSPEVLIKRYLEPALQTDSSDEGREGYRTR